MKTEWTKAEVLLQISVDQPELLFSFDEKQFKQEWLSLALYWHPDRNLSEPCTNAVLQHINSIYDAARKKFALGLWENGNELKAHATNGSMHHFKFFKKRDFELETAYISDSKVIYIIEKENFSLFDATLKSIKAFRYADRGMEREMSDKLPAKPESIETSGFLLLVIPRPEDMVALADLLEYLGKPLETKHTAWIVSGLNNIACYLEWAGLMHGAISAETVFISPQNHNINLIGGWWYTTKIDAELTVLPERTVSFMPPVAKSLKRATGLIDRELIRQLARELFKEPDDHHLLRHKDIPKPFAKWIVMPPSEFAYQDYKNWERAREQSFGIRKFVKMSVKVADIYK